MASRAKNMHWRCTFIIIIIIIIIIIWGCGAL